VVSGPSAPALQRLEDLSGNTIHVRRSSSYYESLVELNERFLARGLAPLGIIEADEALEDEDLLELVNAGLIPMIIMDDHKATFWSQLMDRIELHDNLALREEGRIAWAIRPGSHELKAEIDAFVAGARKGTLLGNVLFQRYLEENQWVSNPLSQQEVEHIEHKLELFQKYGELYDFDWTMLAAIAYQESGLDQSKRSPVGAVGVMQILPSTAADPNVGIPDIEELENNVHAGTKYLSFLRERYFSGDELDRVSAELFALAAYNAGPARVAELRVEAASRGLDPNVWFQNVEIIAARRIGRETVRYVSNIFKYFIAYSSLAAQQDTREAALESLEAQSGTASAQ
jgi:membrane-bound lytic murein transglycosylase MltF